jgi:high affinity Mn2+ porin
MRRKLLFIAGSFFWGPILWAQTGDSARQDGWSYHFQLTVIDQNHAGFKAAYSGMNSLADSVETGATSITTTLFLGRRLWKNAAIYVDPELSGGKGLSFAVGVAGALNGETYRIGDPAPVLSIARTYLQQIIPLGHTDSSQEDGVNQLGGQVPSNRIVLSAGKFSMSDFYDKNNYSHDPRSQFLNWSLMSDGAWDYPANTKGYTMGLVAEWINPRWELRVSSVAVPKVANHPSMEYVFGKAHSETVEFQKNIHLVGQRPGKVALLVSYTASRAPSYQQGLAALRMGDSKTLDVISGNDEGSVYGGHKTGVGLNVEQALSDNLRLFARAGWNDGKDVSWAFTEIDETLSAGFSLKGTRWKRSGDVVGLAQVVNGISADHRAFLEAGGYGFIIGDGRLNYGHEAITELYYNARLTESFFLTLDYQLVLNPGYNKDRQGPVHVFAFRAHFEL